MTCFHPRTAGNEPRHSTDYRRPVTTGILGYAPTGRGANIARELPVQRREPGYPMECTER
jgi:hypothetical protein